MKVSIWHKLQLLKFALSSKKLPTDIPVDPDIVISSDSGPRIKVFDESVDSGKCIGTDLWAL